MTNRLSANVLILGLAVVGAVVIAPWLFGLTVGAAFLIVRLIGWMLAGALAGRFLRGEGYGVLADIGLGIIGGIIGSFLFSIVGLGWMVDNLLLSILVGAVGAMMFIWLVRLFNRDFAR